jgi:phosphoglycerate kinase
VEFKFKEIEKANVKNKKVIVRVCFDVPIKNGKITDDTRIKSAIPTINWLLKNGAAVILISKLGRPEGKVVPELSLGQVTERLSELIEKPVNFVPDCIGPKATDATEKLKSGEVLLLENLRFHPEEEDNDPDFAQELASFGDLFVMDDFPNVKNDHAGITGITEYLPSYAGINFAMEIKTLAGAFNEPKRPFVAVIGGAKVSTKIDVLKSLIRKVDVLIIGGGMANTFLAAEGYEVGKSLYEPDFADSAIEITRLAEDNGIELMLPDDIVVSKSLTSGTPKIESLEEVEKNEFIVDIGPRSVSKYAEPLKFAGTIFWNGPVGVNEVPAFAKGTIAVAKIISESRGKSIIGGGDTVSAVSDLSLRFDFVSTGGGATLELLSGENLPGLEALEK